MVECVLSQLKPGSRGSTFLAVEKVSLLNTTTSFYSVLLAD